jgi:hypothetical protein
VAVMAMKSQEYIYISIYIYYSTHIIFFNLQVRRKERVCELKEQEGGGNEGGRQSARNTMGTKGRNDGK